MFSFSRFHYVYINLILLQFANKKCLIAFPRVQFIDLYIIYYFFITNNVRLMPSFKKYIHMEFELPLTLFCINLSL